MAGKNERKVVVKKVPAFPIPAQLKIGAANIQAKILRLNTRGLMAEVPAANLEPGEKCEMSFEIPVLHLPINEPMVVVKQYSQWQGGAKTAPPSAPAAAGSSPGVAHLVEVHFVSLSEKARENIVAFLKKIGAVDA